MREEREEQRENALDSVAAFIEIVEDDRENTESEHNLGTLCICTHLFCIFLVLCVLIWSL